MYHICVTKAVYPLAPAAPVLTELAYAPAARGPALVTVRWRPMDGVDSYTYVRAICVRFKFMYEHVLKKISNT